MSLTEDEKYAILANVPYQIHEGVPIDLIEEELRLYGLDHQIDRELTDRVGAVIHNDDEVIHSVRGTDFTNLKDVMSDVGLIVGNPMTIESAKFLLKAESIPYTFHRKFLGNPMLQIPGERTARYFDDVRPLFTGRAFLRDYMFSEQMNQETYQYKKQTLHAMLQMLNPQSQRFNPEIIQDTDDLEDHLEDIIGHIKDITKKSEARMSDVYSDLYKSYGVLEVGPKILDKFRRLPEYLRIEPERERLLKVLKKYPNKTPSLTGHSLGSVVNVLGREYDIKSITFNPAPQGDEVWRPAHKDSKVYRIKGDPVSYHRFRTESDTEPVVEFEPRYGFTFEPLDGLKIYPDLYHYHLLSQFIPEKPKIQIEKVLYSPFNYRPIRYDNKRVSQVFDYCKEYPYLAECQGKREKEYF